MYGQMYLMPQVRDNWCGRKNMSYNGTPTITNKLLLMMGLLLCTRDAIVSCLQGVLILIGPAQPVDAPLGRVVTYGGKNLILFLYQFQQDVRKV